MHFSVNSSTAKKIIDEGIYHHAPSINVKYLESKDYLFSVVISKKQGAASERNRVKRVIREIMRCNNGIYPPGFYMIYYNGKCSFFNRIKVMSDLDEIMRKISVNQNYSQKK